MPLKSSELWSMNNCGEIDRFNLVLYLDENTQHQSINGVVYALFI
ncbi:hypothetical protein XIS1_940005 [Xenorhabdus innexi]|uniref:Uncharacterized protein n=1 Tax=Xenorhabdus innexi TaxID=290109 RepID=A0A1N6N220_9GAMM|nr:hypothetical protein XIS1_940005 [Xenorhabdus innexi]